MHPGELASHLKWPATVFFFLEEKKTGGKTACYRTLDVRKEIGAHPKILHENSEMQTVQDLI